jgi:RNase P subunit RPR2
MNIKIIANVKTTCDKCKKKKPHHISEHYINENKYMIIICLACGELQRFKKDKR